MSKKYIDPELVKIANEQDVFDMLCRDGVPLKQDGRSFRHREHNSLVVTKDKGFYYFSKNIGSSSPIKYYMVVENMDFVEATEKVLSLMNIDYNKKNITIEKRSGKSHNHIAGEFVIPKEAEHSKNVYAYLTITRKLDKDLVKDLIDKKAIYQEADKNNVVFLGKDYEGNTVSAYKRGTNTFKSFKGEQENSSKDYRFRIENKDNTTVNVFEAEIDLLSYISMHPKIARTENYIALGGVSDRALIKFLENRKDIENINICTDNDEAGNKFLVDIADKLGKDYFITREKPYNKDFNEDLKADVKYRRDRIEVISFDKDTKDLTKKEKESIMSKTYTERYGGLILGLDKLEDFEMVRSEALDLMRVLRGISVEKNFDDEDTKYILRKPIILDGDVYNMDFAIKEDEQNNHRLYVSSVDFKYIDIELENALKKQKEEEHTSFKKSIDEDFEF